MKDELRNDGDPIAWRLWSTAQNQLMQLRQPDPPVVFPGDQAIFTAMHTQVRKEELGLLLPLPALEHFVSSWVHLT